MSFLTALGDVYCSSIHRSH